MRCVWTRHIQYPPPELCPGLNKDLCININVTIIECGGTTSTATFNYIRYTLHFISGWQNNVTWFQKQKQQKQVNKTKINRKSCVTLDTEYQSNEASRTAFNPIPILQTLADWVPNPELVPNASELLLYWGALTKSRGRDSQTWRQPTIHKMYR